MIFFRQQTLRATTDKLSHRKSHHFSFPHVTPSLKQFSNFLSSRFSHLLRQFVGHVLLSVSSVVQKANLLSEIKFVYENKFNVTSRQMKAIAKNHEKSTTKKKVMQFAMYNGLRFLLIANFSLSKPALSEMWIVTVD